MGEDEVEYGALHCSKAPNPVESADVAARMSSGSATKELAMYVTRCIADSRSA